MNRGNYHKTARPKKELTRREREILSLAAKGCSSTKELGDMLGVSIKTIETHKKNIMDKSRPLAKFVDVVIKWINDNLAGNYQNESKPRTTSSGR